MEKVQNYIIVRGARQHNLKNVNVKIPKNKLVVFTGVSGSGKSSLAFDTIYAEGQRRYVQSLSAYARQFLGVMDKPDVDSIEGLSPAISIDQKATTHNPRSTVGTITEVYDFLRLLFARLGHPHCPACGREISRNSIAEIVEKVKSLINQLKAENKKQIRFLILAPLVKNKKGEYLKLLMTLKKRGLVQARIDKRIFDLGDELNLIKTNRHSIEAVIDKLIINQKDKQTDYHSRLFDSLETALNLADGEVIVSQVKDKGFSFPADPKQFADYLFSEKLACPNCQIALSEVEPRTFSFNSPEGACLTCHGLGNLLKVSANLVYQQNLTVNEGAILPYARTLSTNSWFRRQLEFFAKRNHFDLNKPLEDISESSLKLLSRGDNYGFEGIINNLERRYGETNSDYIRTEIEKYMIKEICPNCQGKRLKKEALSITIDNHSIADISRLSIKKLTYWLKKISFSNLSQREKTIAQPILKELKSRLDFLNNIGLDYLSIDRSASTLAGGEMQRIRLASQLGSGLTGILYVLDEPTIGLHQRDNLRLIETLKGLRDLQNTVIVVEHDRETMKNADYIIDFGPKAGKNGGKIVFQGSFRKIIKHHQSLTGQYLCGKRKIEIKDDAQNRIDRGKLTLIGASQFNLKNITVDFPLGKLILVTGVSGSGKSTLIHETLYHGLSLKTNPFYKEKPGKFKRLLGSSQIKRVSLIDQSPIGRTPRSNPATYTGVFTFIREVFAQTKLARLCGYNKSRFSFNIKGGRCEACQGQGQNKIEMQFLPDLYVACEVCQGKRFNAETLEVQYANKNIAEILNLTVGEALSLFKHHQQINTRLQTLVSVGLDYISLGQSAPTLSGGEAQRVKLASELSKKAGREIVYLLDEPTTGLHFDDLQKLIKVFKKLVERGSTVIVIEHNLDVIKNADYIIDLGPEGGDDGGFVVATGSPLEIAQNTKSYTGQFLKSVMGKTTILASGN